MINDEIKFMKKALKQAEKAVEKDEVPIGCVIVKDGKIISRAYNQREKKMDSTSHAEIIAIQKACKKLKNWRLIGCEIYVTIEPCLMCAGAINLARIKKVYFGAYDKKGGAYGSSINSLDALNVNHRPLVKGGILEKPCSDILKNYFKMKREQK